MASFSLPRVAAQPLWLLKIAVAVFLLLKLAYFLYLPPIGDEAYYWLWGQHPELSYLDHPPLHAWLLWLVSRICGWNLYSLRLLTWLTFGVNVWIVWLLARRLTPRDPRPWFWAALLIYLASPIMFVLGSISFHDHLLITLCLVSGYFFVRFADGWTAGRGAFGDLYLAALFLGLATLTKYNGALLGLAYLAVLLARTDLRPLLRRPQPYLAAALAVALQAPVVWWNLANGLASFRFHAVDRWDGQVDFSLLEMLATLIASALMLGVLLIAPLARLFRPGPPGFEATTRSIAAAVLALSTLVICATAAFVSVPGYWNVVAYPLALPLLVRTIATRAVFWLHALLGALFAGLFFIEIAIAPLGSGILPAGFYGTAYTNYDWDRIAGLVEAAQTAHPGAFVAATRYTTAAQLAFALHDADVTDISDRHTEFNYWFDPAAHRGQSALVLAAPFIPVDFAARQFRRVTLLQNIEIVRLGHPVGSYQLYLGEDYCGGPCN